MKQSRNLIANGAEEAHVTPSRRTGTLRWLGLALAMWIGGSLGFAQTLAVTPSNYPTVSVGATQQFTATASGFTIASIKWEVGNVQGGSTATGTITTGLTGGLYTAPATVPAQNPQTILAVATDTNGNKYSSSVYVSIAPPPPVITAVSPNPLPTGSATVTVTGTGFTSSSLIWDSGVQYATQQSGPGTLTASVYTAAGTTSASFTIHSSGTISNAFVVPVGGNAPPKYTLTVVNGTGSGSYAAGTVVPITANAPPSGQQFQSWTGAAVAGAGSATTTLTMPAANTTVTANFTAASTYTLTVVNGAGSGSYAAGTVVPITANAPPSGQQFQSWTGATVASASSAATTLTMPASNTTVTANFAAAGGPTITSVSPNPLPTGTVTVTITGTGFTSSSTIWDSGVQYTTQQPTSNTLTTSVYTAPGTTSATFTVHGPGPTSNAVTVPVSGPPTYTLTVVNGTGSGSYTAGTGVTITANPAPAGESFSAWTGAAVSNAATPTTTITMPAANTTVTANYSTGPTYALTVVGGQGSGNYVAGAVVTITANNPAAGQSFLGWTGATFVSANSPTTTLTMPAAALTVTANFSQAAYTLTVVNGTGSGNYAAGAVVQITANTPPAGQYFQHWTGAGVANTALASTTVTMPQANTTVTANFYTPAPIPQPVTTHPRCG